MKVGLGNNTAYQGYTLAACIPHSLHAYNFQVYHRISFKIRENYKNRIESNDHGVTQQWIVTSSLFYYQVTNIYPSTFLSD